ncbi:uncharacterized protein LOC114258340 isoform X2 [Camellia sinensis]|uniref:uncharacterized protein LOC114258340 isoform X2 n=1 Tax=Camellia sinensis TaxID=4442 RepID=UPI001035A35D|nr:uncharacterized protein LOC114258340 isoform X2 [Camellia sinensis]
MRLWLHLANSVLTAANLIAKSFSGQIALLQKKSRRPWHGMEMTNLYAASVGKLEKIISKFNISKGILVEEDQARVQAAAEALCKKFHPGAFYEIN